MMVISLMSWRTEFRMSPEFSKLDLLFPDAIGDCPYCIDDMGDNITFLSNHNDTRLFFQVRVNQWCWPRGTIVETWEWKNNKWVEVPNCL